MKTYTKALALLLSTLAFPLGTLAQTDVNFVIAGGHVKLADGTHLVSPEDGGDIDVKDGSTLTLGGNSSVVTGDLMTIDEGGLVQGCGTLNIKVLNRGTVLANCGTGSLLLFNKQLSMAEGSLVRGTGGSEIEFGLSLLSRGLIQLLGGSFLTFDGGIPFTNLGIIDLLNGDAGTLPDGITSSGVIYTRDNPPKFSLTQNETGDVWQITVDGIVGHYYHFQTRQDLGSGTWTTADTRFADTNGPITFEFAVNPLETARYWQVLIADTLPD